MTTPCKARHINHVCIAVKDIEETLAFYRDVFGTGEAEVEDIEGKSAWDIVKGREELHGTDAYRRLNPNKPVEALDL